MKRQLLTLLICTAASLAWTLKAWFALLLPTSPRWRDKHEAERASSIERVQSPVLDS